VVVTLLGSGGGGPSRAPVVDGWESADRGKGCATAPTEEAFKSTTSLMTRGGGGRDAFGRVGGWWCCTTMVRPDVGFAVARDVLVAAAVASIRRGGTEEFGVVDEKPDDNGDDGCCPPPPPRTSRCGESTSSTIRTNKLGRFWTDKTANSRTTSKNIRITLVPRKS